MGFKDTLAKRYTDSYFRKYGDRLTNVQGRILSFKISPKTILWIYHKIMVDVLIKPERSKAVVRCQYKKVQWFKKPAFIDLGQGHLVLIQGLKGKKGKEGSEIIQILNIMNLTTKKDLIPVDRKPQRVQQKQFIK